MIDPEVQALPDDFPADTPHKLSIAPVEGRPGLLRTEHGGAVLHYDRAEAG